MTDAFLAHVINAASDGLCAVFYFLEPWGVSLFWFFSLFAVLRLLLRAFGDPAAPDRSPGQARPGQAPWQEWSLVLAITALGAAIRFYGRDALPYWWDELLAVWISGSDIPTIIRTLGTPVAPASDFTPPVFYLLLHAWNWLGGDAEAHARLLTASFSVLTIPALHVLGKRLWGTGAGLAAAFLLSVSMVAVSFSQQVRCYSLLALLAVLFMIALDRYYRKPSRSRAMAFVACGALFLHTHFVATWIYCGLGLAVLVIIARQLAWRRWPGGYRTASTLMWRTGLVLGCFLVAAVCPSFSPLAMSRETALILMKLGLGSLFLLVVGRPAPRQDAARPARQDLTLLAIYCLPGLLFLPWLLHTRIWAVIAGKSAYSANAFGLTDLQGLLDYFAGLELSSTLYLLLVGLLAMFVRRPRSALLMCGYMVLPTGLTLLAQNKNMNGLRYLFLTQPGYPLLMAVTVSETLDCAWTVLSRAATLARGRVCSGNGCDRGAPGYLVLAVAVALFGFVGMERISFPTQAQPPEDYVKAASYLGEHGLSCMNFESENMLRAITWSSGRLGYTPRCGRGSSKAFLLNVYPDGRSWAENSTYADWVKAHAQRKAEFSGLACYVWDQPEDRAPSFSPRTVTLSGIPLAIQLQESEFLAFAKDQINPAGKKKLGHGVYEFKMPGCTVEHLALNMTALAAGPASHVLVKASVGQGGPCVAARIDGTGVMPDDLDMKTVQSVADLPVPAEVAPGSTLTVEIELYDDGSGAIYSSNAGLASVTVSY